MTNIYCEVHFKNYDFIFETYHNSYLLKDSDNYFNLKDPFRLHFKHDIIKQNDLTIY